ncbi:hypothetical protein M5D96_006123, partial [Drosophila gunungcola]
MKICCQQLGTPAQSTQPTIQEGFFCQQRGASSKSTPSLSPSPSPSSSPSTSTSTTHSGAAQRAALINTITEQSKENFS